ncbi:MAG: hypothetical protein AVDCRST_MAG38-2997, partial [uncultured Solirubrobacteraceae bacterium]
GRRPANPHARRERRPPDAGAAPRAAARARAGRGRTRLPLLRADRALQPHPAPRRAGHRGARVGRARAAARGAADRLRHPRHPGHRRAAGGAARGRGAAAAARVRAARARVHLPRAARAARAGARREPARDDEPVLRGGDHPEEPGQAARRGGAGLFVHRVRPRPAHVLPPLLLALRRAAARHAGGDPLGERAPGDGHEPRGVEVQVPRRQLAAGARAVHRALPLRAALAAPARAHGRRGRRLRGRAQEALPRPRAAVAVHRAVQDRDHRRPARAGQPARDQPADLARPVRRLRARDRHRARRRREAGALAEHRVRHPHLGGEGRARERHPARAERGHRAAPGRARRGAAAARARHRRAGAVVPLPGHRAPRAARRLAHVGPGRVRGDHRHRGRRRVDAAARDHGAAPLVRGGAGLRRRVGARPAGGRAARAHRRRAVGARAVRRDDRGERLARPPARGHGRGGGRARPRAARRRAPDAPRGAPHARGRRRQAAHQRGAQDRARPCPRRPPAPAGVRGVLPPPRPGVQADDRAAPQGPGRRVEHPGRLARPGVPGRVRPHLRAQGRPRLARRHLRRAAGGPVLLRRRAGAAGAHRRRRPLARGGRVV